MQITQEEAEDLRSFLKNEIIRYGFSPIVEEADKRILERYIENENYKPYNPNSIKLLADFINETLLVFNNFSNSNYGELIKKINKNLDGEQIEAMHVELIGQSEPFNLSQLPDYSQIYNVLAAVREDILKDN